MTIYDAAMKYKDDGVPLIVLAGKEYGSGSSRDWAAKGTLLLGVRAVIAESFERIHRSNLVNMGVLPLQFRAGEAAASLGLTGREQFDIVGVADGLTPGGVVTVRARAGDPTPHRSSSRPSPASTRPRNSWRSGTAASCLTCCGSSSGRMTRHCVIRHEEFGIRNSANSERCRDQEPKARELGFDACGIAPAADLPELAFFAEWLTRGYGGSMAYLARSAERRADVRRVLPSARSVIVVAVVYNTDRPYSTECEDPARAHIARYAWGDDYHEVIGSRLEALAAWMREQRRRAVRRACLRRHGPGPGARLRAARRHRLDRQEHLRDQSRARIVDLSRRDHLQPGSRAGRAVARPVRHLHAVPRGVSDAGAGRAGRARLEPLHFLPDDRASRRDRSRRSQQASARTSTAATSARRSARGTPSRRPRTIRRGSRARCGIGRRSPSSSGCRTRALRSALDGSADGAREARRHAA